MKKCTNCGGEHHIRCEILKIFPVVDQEAVALPLREHLREYPPQKYSKISIDGYECDVTIAYKHNVQCKLPAGECESKPGSHIRVIPEDA